MSKNKIEIPTMDDAKKRWDDFEATPLDEFIYNCEPSDKVRKAVFREHLESAIYHIIDSQGSFGLTLDAADSEQYGAEKIYSAKALIENLNNAINNGYEKLSDTDIGDLLLVCEQQLKEDG